MQARTGDPNTQKPVAPMTPAEEDRNAGVTRTDEGKIAPTTAEQETSKPTEGNAQDILAMIRNRQNNG